MHDGEVNIKTTLDTEGLDKGLEKLEKALQGSISEQARLNDTSKKATAGLKDETTQTKKLTDQEKKATEETKKLNKEQADTTKTLNKTGKEVQGFSGKLTKLNGVLKAIQASAAIGTIVKTLKKVGETLRETSEAYKVQEKAEIALQTAAEKNPYLDRSAVESLKQFASELQSVTNIGDEVSIQFMTTLAAQGRTQEQIQKIMIAAINMSASGATSLESAVTNLAKTYGGMAGELGESVPALRNLTVEQLKNGEAVDIINEKYKDMAFNLSDVKIQMENAKGDFKEAIGELTEPTVNLWDNFWKTAYEKGIEFFNWFNDKIDKYTFNRDIVPEVIEIALAGQEDTLSDEALEGTIDYLEEIEEKSKNISEEQQKAMRAQYGAAANGYILSEQERFVLRMLRHESEVRKENARLQEEAKKTNEEVIEDAKKEEQKKTLTADDYAIMNNKALDKAIEKLKIEAELRGENVDEQALFNTYLQSYINLMTESEGLIKEGYPVEEKRKQQVKEAQKAAEEAAKAAQDKANADAQALEEAERLNAATEELRQKTDDLNTPRTNFAQLEAEHEQLLQMAEDVKDNEIMLAEEKQERLDEINAAIAQNEKDQWEEALTQIQSFTQEAMNTATEAANLVQQNNESKMNKELAENEIKYRKGEISEKQFEEKKKAIKKEAAKEQYKIDLFNWTTSLLTTTANIAQGVSKAIAQGGVAGLATGALVAAAGGVQIASIIASKPQAPQFAKGGIVPGQSYTGDRVTARVNSGEMILTTGQQAALFNMANGKGGFNKMPNITINNSASNLVDATPQINENEVGIMIDARVNEGLQQGNYSKSLIMAQQNQTGDYYGI